MKKEKEMLRSSFSISSSLQLSSVVCSEGCDGFESGSGCKM